MFWKTPATKIPDAVKDTLSKAKRGIFEGWEKITLPETVPEIYKIRHEADNNVYTAYNIRGFIRVTDDLLQDWTEAVA